MTKLYYVIWVVVALSNLSSVSIGEEFRIATQVFVGAEEEHPEPVLETVTVFSEGVVYDFLALDSGGRHQEEMTVFDPKRSRIVLLDPRRRIKTNLTTDSVLGFVAQIKARLEDTDRGEFANPVFETSYDEETKVLTLQNDRMRYDIRGMKPKSIDSLNEYIRFADWYARINAMRPGNSPPFARLRVNAELSERQWLPTEVTRTVYYRKGLRRHEYVMRSRHQMSWVLSQSDRQRIERAGTALAKYASVRYSDYLAKTSRQFAEQD